MNLTVFTGFVGKDPEVRQTEHGPTASFTLATERPYDSTKTDWHFIEVYNPQMIERQIPHIKKGKHIEIVGGSLEYRQYERAGQKQRHPYIALRYGASIRFTPAISTQGSKGPSQPETKSDQPHPPSDLMPFRSHQSPEL